MSATINRVLSWDVSGRMTFGRAELAYPSNLTDTEWAVIEPLLPPARGGGNKRTVDMRLIVDAVLYVMSNGCKWSQLPPCFPPRTTLNTYVGPWRLQGTIDRIHSALYRR